MTKLTSPRAVFLKDEFRSPDLHSGSRSYARRFSGEIGAWFLEKQEAALLAVVSLKNPSKILDVGGGHGQAAIPLARLGHQVCVLISCSGADEQLDEMLQRESAEVRSRVLIRVGTLSDPELRQEEFDVIVSFRMLGHVPDWLLFVQQLCELKPRCLVIEYSSKKSLNVFSSLLFRFKKGFEKDTRPFQTFYDREVYRALSLYGFHTFKIERQFFFPMVFHRIFRMVRFSRILESGARRLGLVSRFGSPAVLCANLDCASLGDQREPAATARENI